MTATDHAYIGRVAAAWRLLQDHERATAALLEDDLPLPPDPNEPFSEGGSGGLLLALAEGWDILLSAGYSQQLATDALRSYYPEAEAQDIARAYWLATTTNKEAASHAPR